MTRLLLALLLAFAGVLHAQTAAPPPPPTPEELAFARLAPDIQQMLGHLTAAQAMQTVRQAEQHLIALGMPNASGEQFRTVLRALLLPSSYEVGSASAGATSFPPLSPLVPAPR